MSPSSVGIMPPLVSQSAITSAPASAAARTHSTRVGRVGPVAVEEVLGVEEDPLALLPQVAHRVGDHRQVLVERGPQGQLDVAVVALGDQRHDRGARLAERGDLRVVGGVDARLAGRAERGERGVAQVELGLRAAEELGVLRNRARPAALDEPDAETVQVPGDHQLVGNRQVQALLLGAVAEGGVVDVKLVVEHSRCPFLPYRLADGGWANKKTPRGTREVWRRPVLDQSHPSEGLASVSGKPGSGVRPGIGACPHAESVPRASTTSYCEIGHRPMSSTRRRRLPIIIRPVVTGPSVPYLGGVCHMWALAASRPP